MGILRQIERRVQRTDKEIKKALHKEIIYFKTGKLSLGEFVTCFNTKFTGFKINLSGEDDPDYKQQEIILNDFINRIDSDSKNWINENTPQLEFKKLKEKKWH